MPQPLEDAEKGFELVAQWGNVKLSLDTLEGEWADIPTPPEMAAIERMVRIETLLDCAKEALGVLDPSSMAQTMENLTTLIRLWHAEAAPHAPKQPDDA